MDKEVLTAKLKDDGAIWDNNLLCLLFGCDLEKCKNRDSCTVEKARLAENSLEADKQLVC